MSKTTTELADDKLRYSKSVTIRLPPLLSAALAQQASERGLSVSEVVRRMLLLGLDDVLFPTRDQP